jgi:HK97 family phage major capsid protein
MPFTATTVNSAKAWAPDIYAFAPTDAIPDALILQASTPAGRIEGDEPVTRVAYVIDDEATITPEGQTIDEAEPQLAEVLIHSAKISMLVRVSREQFQQDQTADQLSMSVGRAVTRRADLAFVAEPAPTAPATAPVAGLIHVSGLVAGGEITADLDPISDLIAQIEDNLGTPSHILVDPLGWSAIRKLKTGSAYNSTLLNAGTSDAQQMLYSLPVLVNRAVPDFTGLVVDQTAIVSAVGPVFIATSEHPYFASDSIAVRATFRTGHVVVHPDRCGTFSINAGS